MIDVLMTVYNGADYVRSSVASIQSQSFSDIRIIIVDDGSTDATPSILAQIAAADPRIQIYSKPNGGIVEAANFGLERCSAEFVARMDADDVAYPDRLERQIMFLRHHPNILAISGAARHIGPAGEQLGTKTMFPSLAIADPTSIPAREPYLLHPFLMIRRDAITKIGGYRQLLVAEDSDLYWRLQELGPLMNDIHIYGEYRLNPESISSQSIRSGRILAVYSQLAALSASRRRSHRQDINFTPQLAIKLKENDESLESICKAASHLLSDDEAAHLRFATAVKLMETVGYRPYELDISDCVYLRDVFEESGSSLHGSNRAIVLKMYSGTAARLAAKGRWAEARKLMLPEVLFTFWIRFALRKLLLPHFHTYLHNSISTIFSIFRKA